MKKLTVTIAIPAYNEEITIQELLRDITIQKETNFIINKIMLISDGSTDQTVAKAKQIPDSRLAIENSQLRLGKAKRLNKLFANQSTDILVILDGDIKLENEYTIAKLIEPFIIDNQILVVYGNKQPVLPTNYFGQIAFFGYQTWINATAKVKNDRYFKCGPIIAFAKKFSNIYRIPDNKYITEDTYSFYFAEKYKYKTYFQKAATAYYHLPSTATDYVKQMNRYLTTTNDMEAIYGKELLRRHETITSKIKVKALINSALQAAPHIVLGYILLNIAIRLRALTYQEKIEWEMASTSKRSI